MPSGYSHSQCRDNRKLIVDYQFLIIGVSRSVIAIKDVPWIKISCQDSVGFHLVGGADPVLSV